MENLEVASKIVVNKLSIYEWIFYLSINGLAFTIFPGLMFFTFILSISIIAKKYLTKRKWQVKYNLELEEIYINDNYDFYVFKFSDINNLTEYTNNGDEKKGFNSVYQLSLLRYTKPFGKEIYFQTPDNNKTYKQNLKQLIYLIAVQRSEKIKSLVYR